MSDLFRPEVINAQSDRLLGEVSLGQPFSVYMISGLLLAIIGSIGLFLVFGQYSRTETASGTLVTQEPTIKIHSRVLGTVSNVLVRDGDVVRAGQVLAVVDLDHRDDMGRYSARDAVMTIERRLNLADEKIALTKAQLRNQVLRFEAAISGTSEKITDLKNQELLQQQIVKSTKDLFDKLEQIQKRGFISAVEYEQRRQNYLNSEQTLEGIRYQLASAETERRQARADLDNLTFSSRANENDTASAMQGLLEQRAQIRGDQSGIITAPIAGRITDMHAAVGETTREDIPLMEIIPIKSPLIAELYAPSKAIGFIKKGDGVRLLYDAFPYDHYGSFAGNVLSISNIAINPQEIPVPIKVDFPVYIIKVQLQRQDVVVDGHHILLSPGMTLNANVVLDHQKIYDVLLAPIHAVSQRNR